jgi:hypothetical protein
VQSILEMKTLQICIPRHHSLFQMALELDGACWIMGIRSST